MPGVQEAYSINVSNRYELSLFGADEDDNDSTGELDPLDALKQIEEQAKREVELKKKAASKAKHVKKTTHFKENKDSNRTVTPKTEDGGKDIKKQEINNNNKNQRRERQTNNAGHVGDENRRPPRRRPESRRPPREGGENQGSEFAGGDRDGQQNRYNRGDGDRRPERFRGGRGGGYRGAQRGNRFGGYRNDGRDDRGKREFDRRSGSDRSGVKATEKREGGGSHNWGTPEQEIENMKGLDDSNYENDASPAKNDPKSEQDNANGTDGEKEDKSDEEPKEKEPVEMTLDEWKALQSATVKPTGFKVRRPGEGENPDQWKGMKVIHKSKEEVEAAELTKENIKTQVKPTIPVNIRFGDGARPGGRGGRGRGGRGRGAPRQYGNRDNYGNNRKQAPPDVENENEFPTLG